MKKTFSIVCMLLLLGILTGGSGCSSKCGRNEWIFYKNSSGKGNAAAHSCYKTEDACNSEIISALIKGNGKDYGGCGYDCDVDALLGMSDVSKEEAIKNCKIVFTSQERYENGELVSGGEDTDETVQQPVLEEIKKEIQKRGNSIKDCEVLSEFYDKIGDVL